MISAKVVLASVPASKVNKKRIVTFELRYNRSVHSELMTHRAFSRCGMSSRATPVREMLREVVRDPAMPIEWGANQRGMEAPGQLTGVRLAVVKAIARAARWPAVLSAWILLRLGLAKQVVNRYLEPWVHIRVVVTATELDNFFALRCNPAAEPTMRRVAEAMFVALAKYEKEDKTQELRVGQWHTPYVDRDVELQVAKFITDDPDAKKYLTCSGPAASIVDVHALYCMISAARCARVSLFKHDGGKPSVAEDLELYGRLASARPMHASPMEHQATPARKNPSYRNGNLVGWSQFRQTLPGNVVESFDPDAAEWTPWAWFQLAALGALKGNVLRFGGKSWSPSPESVDGFTPRDPVGGPVVVGPASSDGPLPATEKPAA